MFLKNEADAEKINLLQAEMEKIDNTKIESLHTTKGKTIVATPDKIYWKWYLISTQKLVFPH